MSGIDLLALLPVGFVDDIIRRHNYQKQTLINMYQLNFITRQSLLDKIKFDGIASLGLPLHYDISEIKTLQEIDDFISSLPSPLPDAFTIKQFFNNEVYEAKNAAELRARIYQSDLLEGYVHHTNKSSPYGDIFKDQLNIYSPDFEYEWSMEVQGYQWKSKDDYSNSGYWYKPAESRTFVTGFVKVKPSRTDRGVRSRDISRARSQAKNIAWMRKRRTLDN